MSTSLCSAVTYRTGLGECREDISCIISCSSKRCRSDLVDDMPSCFSVSYCLALLYTILSLTDALFICLRVSPSQLYLFSSMFISLFSYHIPTVSTWQQRGHIAGRVGRNLLPLLSRRHARCRLYTNFWPHGQEGVFSVALGLHFQKAFPSPCLSALHVWRKLRPLFSNQKC